MERRALWIAAGAAASAAIVALVMTCALRRGEPESAALPMQRNGVKLWAVKAPVADALRAAAGPGDYRLESEMVRLAVGASAGGVERALRRGLLLDLGARDLGDDALYDARTVLRVAQRDVELAVESVTAVLEDRPAIRVVQSSGDPEVRVVTMIRLPASEPWAELTTTLENRSGQNLRAVRLGDRVRWPGDAPFAPGQGYVEEELVASVPWVARRAPRLAYALVPEGVRQTFFIRDRTGPSEVQVFDDASDLAAGETRRYGRHFVVVSGGLDEAAAVAWSLQKRRLGEVRVALGRDSSWARLLVKSPDGRVQLEVRVPSTPVLSLNLPVGRYRLELVAPGGSDEQPIRVREGATEAVGMIAPEPGFLRYSVVDSAGRPMPARLVIRGAGVTPDPNFGTVERASGVRNVVYAGQSEGKVELPRGRYRVTVTRGFEYSLFEREVAIGADTGAVLRAELERLVDHPGWLGCDLHVHAEPSFDSTVTLADRVLSLAAEGVEFAAATDHNHVSDYGPVLRRTRLDALLGSATGIEITTSGWGHFIAFPYPRDAPAPPYAGVHPAEIFAAVRTHAPWAVLQVNHPRMKGIGYFDYIGLDPETGHTRVDSAALDFDSIEVVNGFELEDETAIERNLKDWFALLGRGHRFTAVGNSDSHRLTYQWAGYPRTYVRLEADQAGKRLPDQVAGALVMGRAQVSNGPFISLRLNGRAQPGDLVLVEDGFVAVEVGVRAPPWVDVREAELFVNGESVALTRKVERRGAPARIQWRRRVAVPRDGWILVVVRGRQPLGQVLPETKAVPFAFTNPVFLDTDGDGKVAPYLSDAADPGTSDEEPAHDHDHDDAGQ
ncbi:MAG TPA: CehA/McbA family metallohydrolase [Polyangiaceae bacterium]